MPEAFETPGVCSNYHQDYVKKTFPSIQNFKEGNALFTFPNTPIKCAGAPQKIMYITDYHFRQVSFTYHQMSWGPTYVRTFLLHKVRENRNFLDHPPTPMSLRNIKMAPNSRK